MHLYQYSYVHKTNKEEWKDKEDEQGYDDEDLMLQAEEIRLPSQWDKAINDRNGPCSNSDTQCNPPRYDRPVAKGFGYWDESFVGHCGKVWGVCKHTNGG